MFNVTTSKGNKDRRRMIAFILMIALVLTAIIPLNAMAGNDPATDSAKALVQFAYDGEIKGNLVELEVDETSKASLQKGDIPDPSNWDEGEFKGWSIDSENGPYLNEKELLNQEFEGGKTFIIHAAFETDKQNEDKKQPEEDNNDLDNNDQKKLSDNTYSLNIINKDGTTLTSIDVPKDSKISDKINEEKLESKLRQENKWPEATKTVLYYNTAERTDLDYFNFEKNITENTNVYISFYEEYLVNFHDFDSNGKYKVFETQFVKPGEIVQSPTKDPSILDGKKLDGWYYVDGDNENDVTFGKTRVNGDMNVFPRVKDIHSVIFITYGSKVDAKYIEDGKKVVSPSNPTRIGYAFDNAWTTDEEGKNTFNFNTPITKDTILYAKWKPEKVGYTVVFWYEKPNMTKNGAPVDNNPDNFQYSRTEKIAPTTYNNKAAYAGSTIEGAVRDNNDTRISFKSSRGNVNVDFDRVPYGDYAFIKCNDENLLGNGETVINVYYKRTAYTLTFDMSKGIEHYYNSSNKSTTRNYDDGKFSFKNNNKVYSGSQYSIKVKLEDDITDIWPSQMNADFPTHRATTKYKDNKDRWQSGEKEFFFTSWRFKVNSSDNNYNGTTYISHRFSATENLLPQGNDKTRSYEPIYYWEVDHRDVNYYVEALPGDRVDLTFNNVGYTKIDISQKFTQKKGSSLSAKELEGYDHYCDIKWNGKKWEETSERNLSESNFLYKRNQSDLKFNSINGTTTADPKDGYSNDRFKDVKYGEDINEYVKRVTAKKEGYKFLGWYFENDYRTPFDFNKINTMPHKDLELYAKYEPTQLKVKFFEEKDMKEQLDSQGAVIGGFLDSDASPYVKGNSYTSKGKNGKNLGVFNGWAYLDGKTSVKFLYDMPLYEDMELYATWLRDGFKVTYEAGDSASGTVPTISTEYDLDTGHRVLGNTGNLKGKDGKIFIGWNKVVNGNLEPDQVYRPGDVYTMDGNVVFRAVYGDPAVYNLSLIYNSNYPGPDKVNAAISQRYKTGDKAIIINEEGSGFSYEGYKLLGWSKDINATEPDQDYEFNKEITMSQDLTLYGVWESNGYTVEFRTSNPEQGTIEGQNKYENIKKGTQWEEAVTVPAVEAKPGYYFAQWLPEFPNSVTKDSIFYAQFEKQKELIITAGSMSKVYDGTELTYDSVESNLPEGYDLVVTMAASSTVKDVDQGKVANTISEYKVMKNGKDVTHEFLPADKVDGELSITPKTVTISSLDKSFTYDGNTHKYNEADAEGFIGNDGLAADAIAKWTGNITTPGSVDNSFDLGTKFELTTGKASNYSFEKQFGMLTMNDNDIVITVKALSADKVYDGKELTQGKYEVEGLPEGMTIKAVDIDGSITNVGTKENVINGVTIETVNGNLVNTDYMTGIKFINGELEVTPKTVTITSLDGTFKYDGSEHQKQEVKSEGFAEGEGFISADDVVASWTGKITDVGTTSNSFTLKVNDEMKLATGSAANYNFVKKEGTLKVTDNDLIVTITALSADKIYDGTPLQKNEYKVEGLPDNMKVKSVSIEGSIKDFGTTTNAIKSVEIVTKSDEKPVNTDNFKSFKTVNGTLEVTKAKVTVTASSASMEYNGNALTNSKYDYTTLPKEHTLTAKTSGSQIEVGTSASIVVEESVKIMNGEDDATKNFDIERKPGTLEVKLADVTVTAGSATMEYNGSALTSGEYDYSDIPEGHSLTAETKGSQTEVGSSANVITENSVVIKKGQDDVSKNFNIKRDQGTLTVIKNKSEVELTAASDDKVYDGRELTNGNYSVNGLPKGMTIEAIQVKGSQLDAGSSDNVIVKDSIKIVNSEGKAVDIDGFESFKINNGTLKVKVKTVTISSLSKNFVYNGDPQTHNVAEADGFVDEDGTAEDVIAKWTGIITEPGSETNSFDLKAKDIKLTTGKAENYNFVKAEGELTMDADNASVTITALSADKIYDGKELTEESYKVEGLPKGMTISSIDIQGTLTKVGSEENIINDFEIKTDKGNPVSVEYLGHVELVNGELRIDPKAVTVTSVNASWPYDGSVHTDNRVDVEGIIDSDGEIDERSFNWTGEIRDFGTTDNAFTLEDATLTEGDINNYDVNTVFGTLEITKAENEIVVTASSSSMVYNGTALTNPEYMYDESLLPGEHMLVASTTGSQIEAGSSANKIVEGSVKIFDSSENDVTDAFNIKTVDGTLTVTQVLGEVATPAGVDDEGSVLGEEADPDASVNGDEGSVLGEEAKTSDTVQMGLLIGIGALALLLLAIFAIRRRKTEEK